jgi:hypothetical protein
VGKSLLHNLLPHQCGHNIRLYSCVLENAFVPLILSTPNEVDDRPARLPPLFLWNLGNGIIPLIIEGKALPMAAFRAALPNEEVLPYRG